MPSNISEESLALLAQGKEIAETTVEIERYCQCNSCLGIFPISKFIQANGETFTCPVCNHEELEDLMIDIKFNQTVADLDRLKVLKEQKSAIEKEEKPLSEKVKASLVALKTPFMEYEGHIMRISYQDRSTMDETKLVEIIEANLTPEEIVELGAIKKISNPEAIKDLLKAGKITMQQLTDCKILNIVNVFNFNPKKRKAKEGEAPDMFGGMM